MYTLTHKMPTQLEMVRTQRGAAVAKDPARTTELQSIMHVTKWGSKQSAHGHHSSRRIGNPLNNPLRIVFHEVRDK